MAIVLVVAPHADDETLGCGGTLLRHIEEGDEVHWLIMTALREDTGFSRERIKQRKNEIQKVASLYQFKGSYPLEFAATTLDTLSKNELLDAVSSIVTKVKPNILYIPYRNDIHSDHTLVFDALSTYTKSFRYPYLHKVRAYETLSETEFSIRPGNNGFCPNLWVDISQYMHKKIEIMKHYQGELEDHPFPRSEKNLHALATLRGATAGVEAAESFMSLKEIL